MKNNSPILLLGLVVIVITLAGIFLPIPSYVEAVNPKTDLAIEDLQVWQSVRLPARCPIVGFDYVVTRIPEGYLYACTAGGGVVFVKTQNKSVELNQ
jgi:hypothetical protein